MFWNKIESTLQLAEPQDRVWHHQIVKNSFASACNHQNVDFTGWAYTLEGVHQGGVFSGRATCNTLRRAQLDIDVATSEAVHVNVSCNGESVWSGLLELAKDTTLPTLHHLSADITHQKEAKAVSDIDVEFIFANQPGSVWVLSETQWAPTIQQNPSWPYASWSILFFTAVLGVLVGLLTVGISISQFLDDPLLSTPVAVIGTLLGYFGLRDIAKIPLGEIVRRLYAWTRSRRSPIAISVLSLLSVGSMLAAAVCVDGSMRRYEYTNAITESLGQKGKPEKLRKAFILEPWRKEAQILFEQETSIRRVDSTREDLRKYVSNFTDDEEVMSAIERVELKTPFYLLENSYGVSDPVIWFASILPEGDGDKELTRRDRAIKLLGTRSSCGAKVLKLLIPTVESQKQLEALIIDLKLSIEFCQQNDPSNYYHQAALDRLGNIEAITDFEKAAGLFNDLLETRSETLKNRETFWRLPDKLILFALFQYYRDNKDEDEGFKDIKAKEILGYEKDGQSFGSVFKSKVYDKNIKYQEEGAWYEGTVGKAQNRIVISELSELSNSGWRF